MVKKEEVKWFPDSPGVYLMKDARGEIIYIGKALSLKKRVASYFLKSAASIKTQIMMGYAEKIEYMQASSEYDALIMEDRLIKQHQPRFNTVSKDDKGFPYIKITREDFPRVFIGRRKKSGEDADYFGPYISAKLLRRALAILRKSFPFCSCRRFPKKECLFYHMKLCAGACQGKVLQKKYLKMILALEDFLTKRDSDLIDELSRAMRRFVKEERFEEAAGARDKLEALSMLISLKKIRARSIAPPDSDFELLGLKADPERVEAFDISNISGQQAVGSMVSFYKGKPDRNNYRRFKIRNVVGIDDCAMMREVVRRRVARLVAESRALPDLIVIDGGRGQLEAAICALKEIRVHIPIIAIAKSRDLIYTVYKKLPVKLGSDSSVLRLVQHLRDEAHRFALKYHRLLRKKKTFEGPEIDAV